MKTFNFIYAITWMNWGLPFITFYGISGFYIEKDGMQFIIWDACHVATKYRNTVTFDPRASVPRGFKKCCKSL